MVIAYLEKKRNKLLEENIEIQSKLTDVLTLRKENIEFIKLLEENTDFNFEVFTPRAVNTFHKRKIEELKNEQNSIECEIEELQNKIKSIESELEEINLIIKDTKEKLGE